MILQFLGKIILGFVCFILLRELENLIAKKGFKVTKQKQNLRKLINNYTMTRETF